MTDKKILTSVSIFAMVIAASGMIASIHAAGEATIWTDKADYSPEEFVTIFGSGFLPDSTVWLNLTRPNGWVDYWSSTSVSDGSFSTSYALDGILGTYLIFATDGTNTATVTFTDAPKVQWATVTPGSKAVSIGSSATYSIAVGRGPGSDSFTASLSIVSASPTIPSGAVSFSPATITCSSSCPGSTLTIDTTSLLAGTYTFKVRAHRVSTDRADSSTVTMVVDATGPVIISDVSPSPNPSGWNNGPVTVTWSVSDPESGISTSAGCGGTILSTETAGTIVTCTATNGGGTSSSATVEVKIDMTSPTISGWRSPGPNSYGWNNGPVIVGFACSDTLSGIGVTLSPAILDGEGAGQSVTGSCADVAGNSASATVSGINIDLTLPEISGSRSPDPNTYGWNNDDVTASFYCSDSLSGVALVSPSTVLSEDGAAQSVTGSCEDFAGNQSTTTVDGINIDQTAPEITGSRDPEANAYGWNNGPVTVSFACSDSLSLVQTVTGGQTIDTEIVSLSLTGVCTDFAGNTAGTTVGPISIDLTPPSIDGSASPQPNLYGWNNSPIAVEFSCSDTLSGIKTVSAGQTIDTEIVSLSLTGICTDLAGNTAQTSVGPISIDLTPPALLGSASPDPNMNGWNNSPVTVSFSCSDSLSGVEAVSGPVTLGEGAIQSVVGGCSDLAGNYVETVVDGINVDMTPPLITASRSPGPNVHGWNNEQVTVSFACVDDLSGVETVSAPTVLMSEGSGQSVTGTCMDLAGNVAATTLGDINIDLTTPNIASSREPEPNLYGWNNGPVTVAFSCGDVLSGVEQVTPSSTIDAEIVALSLTGTCIDNAGNSAVSIVGPISIDLTAPEISGSRSPGPNVHGWNNFDVVVHFDCSDALSGVDSVTADMVVSDEGAGEFRSGVCVDVAGNSSTVAVDGISIDKTPPVIDGSRSPGPNSFGWNNGDVTVIFDCLDGLSGIAEGPETPQIVSIEGAGQTRSATCTDFADNSVSTTVEGINIDWTPPTITGSQSPDANSYGWNNANVTVTFSCEDFLSGVAYSSSPTVLSNEGFGQGVDGFCEDKADNASSATVSGISIDKTPPAILGSWSPDPNEYGWNNEDVTVHFDCSDALSGVIYVTSDQTVTSEGAGQSVTGTCVDAAGNSVSASIGSGINIDKTAPTVTGSRTPGPNSNGWNNVEVAVYFFCYDDLSGVAAGPASPQMVGEEGAGQSRTGSCTDLAGNTSSATVGNISVDISSPSLAGSRSPEANSFGWNSSPVTVTFACGDALSGVASVSSPTTLASEGSGQSVAGTCSDMAGNSSSGSVGDVNIDLTGPSIIITSPSGSYALNVLVSASWSASDSLSGIDLGTVTATTPNGGSINTSTVGTRSFSVSATDQAGNYAVRTATYQIIYSQTCGRKILSPLEQVSSPSQLRKVYKRGSTLPIKFELCDANGNYVGTATGGVYVYRISSSFDAGDTVLVNDSGYSDSGSSVCRYDLTTHQYIYNLSTKTYSAGTYRLEIHLDDGTSITTYFQLAK